MKELWVHAGLPKNGSSALQVFFAKNRKELAKEGIDYLELENLEDAENGQITSGNGVLLARSLLRQEHPLFFPEANAKIQQFLALVKSSAYEKGLVSSEFFSNISIESLKELKNELDSVGVELKILFYVRRQDQFLVSSYMQEVKRHGYTGSLEEFVYSKYKNIHFLNYYGFSRQLSEVIGLGNLKVFRYDLTKNEKEGIVGHFLKTILGYCPAWVRAEGAVNTSPAPSELKLMLLANRFQPRMKFSDFLVEDSQRVGRSTYYPVHNILKPELAVEVIEHFRDQNNLFFEKYCDDAPFDMKIDNEYVDLSSLTYSATEVMDIVSGFLVRFDRRLTQLEKIKLK